MVWVVISHVMPSFGLGLLDMSRTVAAFDMPMRAGQVNSPANSAEFYLRVSALSNCFDIRTKSIPTLASHPISSGRYVVPVKSTDAQYCMFAKCDVTKVIIYVTTHNNPEGWFNIVEQGHPITIDVSGIGTDANKVYAFYVDITCGDNTGGSVLSFTPTTP